MVALSTATSDMTAPPVVSADTVSKVFDSGDGVHGLELDVQPGTIVGLVGPSGSGKTTAVRLMTGVLAPTSGSLSVLGENPRNFDAATRLRLGYMPQQSVLYPNLSVWENLKFLATLYDSKWARRESLEEVLQFVELDGHETKRVSDISGGMKRRLSLAATLIHQPELMFLDEPTAGIDPILRRKFWDRFSALKDQGKTLIVTTQYVGEAAYCDFVAVLADGELLLVETPDGLRRAAYGGDVINIEFVRPPAPELVEKLKGVATASECTPAGLRGLRLVVDEAAVALPALSAWLGENDVAIEQAEEFLPPFDDVFVEIVSRYRDNGAESAPVATLVGGSSSE